MNIEFQDEDLKSKAAKPLESFCTAQSHIHLVSKKHTEAYINYKLFGLLLRLITS